MDMNPAIRARWVADLRSGKYPQARSYLNVVGKGLCCLGVLCEIAVAEGVVRRVDTVGDDGEDIVAYVPVDRDTAEEFEEGRVLPQAVKRWAGITGALTGDPFVSLPPRLAEQAERAERRSLTALNDVRGLSFDLIADAIEWDGQQ